VQRHWRPVALLVAATAFMEFLDATIISTALPPMAASFHVLAVDLNVGITAYMLAVAVVIPVSGWIADRFGARAVFATAVALFTVASVLCALSTSLAQFTTARMLQGVGGALTVPVGRLIVLRASERRDLIAAVAYLTWPSLLAPIVAPALGGFITEHLNWHWIFLINVPLGVIAAALAFVLIPGGVGATAPFDSRGFALTALASVAVMYGLECIGGGAGLQALPWLLLGASALLIALAVRHFRATAAPLIDLSVLRIRSYSVTVVGGSAARAAINAAPFLLPLMFQEAFGMGPLASGLMLVPLFAGNAVMKVVTTPVLRAFGFRRTLLVNGIVGAVALAATAFVTAKTQPGLTAALLFAGGLARSMQFTAFNTLGFADVPAHQTAAANTFASMLMRLSAALGVALGALILRLGALWHGAAAPGVAEFHLAFWLMGALALVGALDALRLDQDAGASIGGRYSSSPKRNRGKRGS
jgi:EmrB/QacA subfamily drug resistance transporter